MDPKVQIALAFLATVAAIASAIAAWKAQTAAKESLNFQKRLAKYQDALFLLRSTLEKLWILKRVLTEPLGVRDEDINSLESMHGEIRSSLDSLVQSEVLLARRSMLFSARSFAEIVDQMPVARGEIDLEIKRIQAKINEIFS